MTNSILIKFLIIFSLNCFILNYFVYCSDFTDSVDIFGIEDYKNEILPQTETTGACSNQLNAEIQKRNCRYGKCEQIKNGTDFACHCDNFISGKRCDRPALDPNDACTSNPCWGDSLCITLDGDAKQFKCLCTNSRRGKYCHIKMIGLKDTSDDYIYNTEIEQLNSLTTTSNLNNFSTSQVPVSVIPTLTDNLNSNTSQPETKLLSISIASTSSSLEPTSIVLTTVTNSQNFSNSKTTTNDYVSKSSTLENDLNNNQNKSLEYTLKSILTTQSMGDVIKTSTPTTTITPALVDLNTTKFQLNTYIPKSEYYGVCNFNTCQLGKCLENGTCECIKPAVGKHCDTIDECLVLNCVHGNCTAGKGCVCNVGFTGSLCEIELITSTTTPKTTETSTVPVTTSTLTSTSSTTLLSTTTIITTTTTTTTTTIATTSSTPKLAINLNKTIASKSGSAFQKHIITNKKTTTKKPVQNKTETTTTTENPKASTIVSTSTLSTKSNEISSHETHLNMATSSDMIAASTTQPITSCENGGLLIDNVCICLNQFSGLRCEILPSFSDSNSINYQTKEPELDSIEMDQEMIPKVKNYSEKHSRLDEKVNSGENLDNNSLRSSLQDERKTEPSESTNNEELIPIFTISRYNTRNKNLTIHRNFFWPWFECFPGNSKVYAIDKDEKTLKVKLISELSINDQVLVVDDTQNGDNLNENSLKFSKVVSFLHRIEGIDANFVRLHYEADNPILKNNTIDAYKRPRKVVNYITLTPRHLILVHKANNSAINNFDYRPSMEVNPGDTLKYYDYNQKMYQIVNVIKTETVNIKNSGIYSPLTESGTLIVDNIQVSCYSLVKDHKSAQFFFNILNRINYFIKLTSDSYVIYSKFLYEILNFVQLSNLFLNVNV